MLEEGINMESIAQHSIHTYIHVFYLEWVSSKAANHKETGSNAFRTLVVTRFGVFYNCIKTYRTYLF